MKLKGVLKVMAVQEKIRRESILEALNVIKTVCNSHSDCNKCPLRCPEKGGDNCFIMSFLDIPGHWKLNDVGSEWSAFKE